MKNYLILVTCCIITGCGGIPEQEAITSTKDYAGYIAPMGFINEPVELTNHQKEINFWSEKIKAQPNGYIYIQKLAALKAREFENSGNIDELYASDSLWLLANSLVRGKHKVRGYLSLSSNAIKMHQFQKALDYCYKAIELTDEKFGPLMMMYDAYMELGNFKMADSLLKHNRRMNDFDYLVRLSKYQDHLGNLDSAIAIMEKAYGLVKDTNGNAALWAQSNLGDMYGHAGRIEASYQYYLGALKRKPDFLYALKGIAWIAYSHDNKVAEAERIMSYVNKHTQLPYAHLMLAEIQEFKGDMARKEQHLQAFTKEAGQHKYMDMYNKYLIKLHTEEWGNYDKALQLAKKEISNRATPMTYNLLAWVYEQRGDHKKALEIIQQHVEGKTFEPEAIYHMGLIYLSNKNYEKAREFLEEALEASYELGPVITANIQDVSYKLKD